MGTNHFDYLSSSRVRDYFSLLKPRVMTLVVFSGYIGLLMAPGKLHPLLSFVVILCIALGSGASAAINMWYERDIDKIMSRTKNRPIPTGRINPEDALYFGVFLAFLAVILLGLVVNIKTAAILLSAILFYVFIYTILLKRRTSQNIVIGGAAGAFPPMIGWAAVTNEISLASFILFLIIFIWTPPHFWALALYKSKDYEKANIPMLPAVKGIDYTKKSILMYTIFLFLVSLLPYVLGISGILYLCFAICLGLGFIYYSYKLYVSDNIEIAPKLFTYSIIYLFLLFFMLAIDKIIYRII